MSDIKLLEGQLASWKKSDSHGRAPSVEFFLQSDEEVEYFQRFTSAKGRGKTHVAGQIFNLAIQISEQDDQSNEAVKLPELTPAQTLKGRITRPGCKAVYDPAAIEIETNLPAGFPHLSSASEPCIVKPVNDRLVFDVVMMCKDSQFQEWMSTHAGREVGEADSAEYVRRVCGVKSRSEICTGSDAASVFHNRIRKPYAEWHQKRFANDAL